MRKEEKSEVETTNKIKDGVYLVVDPAVEKLVLLQKIAAALQEEISVIQVWDHFREEGDIEALIGSVQVLAASKGVPVVVNNRWDLLSKLELAGVHFDVIPDNLQEIRKHVGRNFISGLTCNNDLTCVEWAAENKMDYISFCSIFPSVTANSCDLVNFDTIRAARQTFPGSIFLSGGITPNKIDELTGLNYNGIAVVSGIMSADDPAEAVKKYLIKLNK